jgi:hypothetical protein
VLPQRFVTGTRREDWLPAAQPISLAQPEPHSVLVWVDNQGVAHAREGATGKIIAESSDHASVIRAAINSIIAGTIFLRAGVYTCDVTISKSNIRLIGEGWGTVMQGKVLVTSPSTSDWVWNVAVENLRISASGKGYGLRVEAAQHSLFRNLRIDVGNSDDGIQIGQNANETGLGSFLNTFADVLITGCKRGVVTTGAANAIDFYSVKVGPADVPGAAGFALLKGDSNSFYSPFVEAASKTNKPEGFYIDEKRTRIYNPYMEMLDTGIELGPNALEVRIHDPVYFDVTTGVKGNAGAATIITHQYLSSSALYFTAQLARIGADTVGENALDLTVAQTPYRRGIMLEQSPSGGIIVYVSSNQVQPRLELRNSADNSVWITMAREIALTYPGGGLIVTTPDGTKKYRIRVDNTGAVVTEPVS